MMIARLLLSLKKFRKNVDGALGSQLRTPLWNFARRRGGISTGDEIPLDNFASTHEGPRVRSDGTNGLGSLRKARTGTLGNLASV